MKDFSDCSQKTTVFNITESCVDTRDHPSRFSKSNLKNLQTKYIRSGVYGLLGNSHKVISNFSKLNLRVP